MYHIEFTGPKKSRISSAGKESVTESSNESLPSVDSSSPTHSPTPGQSHKEKDSDSESLLSVDSAVTRRVRLQSLWFFYYADWQL